MRQLLLAILVLTSTLSFSQKERIYSEIESHTGKHIRSIELYNGLTVFNSHFYEFIANGYKLKTNNTIPSSDLSIDLQQFKSESIENGYIKLRGTYIPATKERVSKGKFAYDILKTHTGEIYCEIPLFSGYQDSTIVVSCFNPDPLTTSKTEYGTTISDSSDMDYQAIANEVYLLPVQARFENGIFSLQNDHVKIDELDAPNVAPATQQTDTFLYNRFQSGFEDGNAFYHITKFSEYIKDTLGYSNAMNYQLPIDVHGNSDADNSFFFNNTVPPSIIFGEGGVDDAEDTEIIIHEYAHALSHSVAPNSNVGNERKAIDESLGDYFAQTYTRSIANYLPERVFPWDGHNEFWNGRVSNSSKTYLDMGGSWYSNSEILTAPLMEIYNVLGREKTDQLVLETMYGLTVGMTMTDFGNTMLQKDSILNQHANYNLIRSTFCNRYIFPDCLNSIHELKQLTDVFNPSIWNNEQALQLKSGNAFNIAISNLTGQQVLQQNQSTNVSLNHLKPSIYLATVSIDKQISVFKIIVR